MISEKILVCRECGGLTSTSECTICGSKQLLDKYKGKVIVLDAGSSVIAKKLNKTKNGSYALRY